MLKRYLDRLYNTIESRKDITIEFLMIDDESHELGYIEGRLRFYDGSILEFDEDLLRQNQQTVKRRYRYHYQNSEENLIFRYDSAPHYPKLSTYPHHKHVGPGQVEASQPPDLSDVLREIDHLIY